MQFVFVLCAILNFVVALTEKEISFGIDYSKSNLGKYKMKDDWSEFIFIGDSIIKNEGDTFVKIIPIDTTMDELILFNMAFD